MADTFLTLTEAANLSQADLHAEIIRTIANMDPVLRGGINLPEYADPAALPFMRVQDPTYTVIRESTRPEAAWYNPGEKVTSVAGTVATTDFLVKELKARIPIPRSIQMGSSRYVSQVTQQLNSQLLGMVDKFMETFYYGDTVTNSKEPKGLHKMVSATTPDMSMDASASSATAAALTLTNLDDLISRMKFGCDMLVMSRQMWRRFTIAIRDTTTQIAGNLVEGRNEWGLPVRTYGGIPIFPSDYIRDTELCNTSDAFVNATGGSGTSIYALKFGPDFLHGINLGTGIEVNVIPGPTQDEDSHIIWVTWYVGLVLESPFGLGILMDLAPASAITA